jgi:hypothetical protein
MERCIWWVLYTLWQRTDHAVVFGTIYTTTSHDHPHINNADPLDCPQLSFLTYANNPSPLQITLRRPYPQVSKAEHNNPGTTKAPIVPRLAKTPSPCLDIAYSQ